jgi:hypothetical protein
MVRTNDTIKFGELGDMNNRFYSMLNPVGGYASVDLESLFKAKYYVSPSTKGRIARAVEVGRFYARSLITVHYLNADPVRRKQMQDYLQLINQNYSIKDAFTKAFNASFETMTDEVNRYMKSRKIFARVFDLKAANFSFPEVKPVVKQLEKDVALFETLNIVSIFRSKSAEYMDVTVNALAGYKTLFPDSDHRVFLEARDNTTLSLDERIASLKALQKKSFRKTDVLNALGSLHLEKASQLHRNQNKLWQAELEQSQLYYKQSLLLNNLQGAALVGFAATFRYLDYGTTESDVAAKALDIVNESVNIRSAIQQAAFLHLSNGSYKEAYTEIKRYVDVEDTKWANGYVTWVRDILAISQDEAANTVKTASADLISYVDGSTYQGNILNGLRSGNGVYKNPNGSTYDGSWQQGLPHGKGIFTASNKMVYEGDFVAGAPHGKGTLDYAAKKGLLKYSGDYFHFMEHGKGTAWYHDDTKTVGSWFKGSRHGMNETYIAGAEKATLIDWYIGTPKLTTKNGWEFLGSYEVKTFLPKDEAKGWCKKPDATEYIRCEISDANAKAIK